MSITKYALAGVLLLVTTTGCVSTPTALTAGSGSSSGGWKWPWEGSAPYRYLGAGHYDQKRLLDLEGEFAELAVSPSGRQAVFRGREGRDAYRLFLSDVQGSIRLLAETGLEPQDLSWSYDEKNLVFLTQETTREGMRPDASPDVPGKPSGKTINVLTLATGAIRKVLTLPGIGAFFPSPAHDVAMIYGFTGYKGSKSDFTLDVVDLMTGDRRPLDANPGEMRTTYAGVWSPTGDKMAAFGTAGSAQQIVMLERPDWKGTLLPGAIAWNGRLHWSADGKTLSVFEITPEAGFSRRTVMLGQGEEAKVTIPIAPAPPDFAYGYEVMLPSPDGSRMLAVRRAYSTKPQVLAVDEAPPVAALLFSVGDASVREVMPGLLPIAWLNERQVLCYAGKDQAKRLKVVDL